MSGRTRNRLASLGLLASPARWRRTTLRQLLIRPGFGARCLLELLLALESQGSRGRGRPRQGARASAAEEFRAIAHAFLRARSAQIALAYLEFDGEPPTLQSVGRRFGITRERVRQICSTLAEAVQAMPPHAPALMGAVGALERMRPVSVHGFAAWARGTWGARPAPSLESLARIWGVLGRPVPLARLPDGTHLAAPEDAALADAVTRTARIKSMSTVAWVVERASRTLGRAVDDRAARSIITGIAGVRWLDDAHRWFFNPRPAWTSRMITVIRKVMAVAPRVRLRDLQARLRRADQRRSAAGIAPPRAVLAEFCRHLPFCRVEGEEVIADPAPRPEKALRGADLVLARVLRAHGPLMARHELEELCRGRGMNRATFRNLLHFSPIIARCAPSVYGLVGSRVDRGALRALARPARPQRVLLDHRRTSAPGP
ncbi:MAG: sigma factor-like helix-turn-helix DNA-binding protein [Phycisphaerales bacterium]